MTEQTNYDLSIIYQNSATVHTNKIATEIVDSRDFNRSWQNHLTSMMQTLRSKHTDFLQTMFTDKKTLLENLNSIHFNPHSAFISKALVGYDATSVLPTLECELGYNISKLRKDIEQLMVVYTKCVERLFGCDELVHHKLEKLKKLDSMLSNIIIMETNCVSELQTSISSYIESVFSECKIDSDYNEFCKTYAEFSQLRSAVMILQCASGSSAAADGPLCPICTTGTIDCALVPCGHSFCKECGAKQHTLCYICRCSVENRLRLYFS